MADMVKVTYTLDDETVQRIRRIATRLGKPQSLVVREAVKDYEARSDKLSDEERRRMLAALEELLPKVPKRAQSDVDAELAEIRRARRHGGRKHRAE
jgi:predicted transcriptional regulator